MPRATPVESGLRGRMAGDFFLKTATMMFHAAPRTAPAFAPLALVSALALCFSASAAHAEDAAMPSVYIIGARFASVPELPPIGATVITAEDIRRAGVSDVNGAIRKIGGVYGRQSLGSSPDFDLDLRGFGTNSSQNMVVVLDGVRLSENELSSALLSAIPIDSIERIEITRGGASVLYGDGATGGVINIVTKRPSKQGGGGSIFTEVGQFGLREARASMAKTWDGFALDAAIDDQRTDNYRANNAFKKTSFSGGAQWTLREGRIGLRIDSARQDARLPGALTEAQFTADPGQTVHPNDFGSLDSNRVTASIERHIGNFDLAAELSYRERTTRSTFVDSYASYVSNSTGKQTQFSPRVRHLGNFGNLRNELVLGLDFVRWNRATDSAYAGDPSSNAEASQSSRALYVRDEIRAGKARFSAGARHEHFDKDFSDPLGYATSAYHDSPSLNAWELQGSFDAMPMVTLYAKAGQSYRVANVDENSATSVANKPLAGQTSHDLELGATLGDTVQQLTFRVFRHKLNNEIFYDSSIFANINLDPTRRQGVEIDAMTRIANDWRVSAHVQHVQATFTEGPNAGIDMVLVPKNIISARLSWVPADGQTADIGAQWVDRQRYGSVSDNSCQARPVASFATLDGRYAKKLGAWEVALSVLNLTDKQYFSNAFMGSSPTCKQGVYPADGRQMKLSARYDF